MVARDNHSLEDLVDVAEEKEPGKVKGTDDDDEPTASQARPVMKKTEPAIPKDKLERGAMAIDACPSLCACPD
jgi:hypothetical protein